MEAAKGAPSPVLAWGGGWGIGAVEVHRGVDVSFSESPRFCCSPPPPATTPNGLCLFGAQGEVAFPGFT